MMMMHVANDRIGTVVMVELECAVVTLQLGHAGVS